MSSTDSESDSSSSGSLFRSRSSRSRLASASRSPAVIKAAKRRRRKKRRSMEDQLDQISKMVLTLQNVVMQSGILKQDIPAEGKREKGKQARQKGMSRVNENEPLVGLPFSHSSTTIYKDLIPQAKVANKAVETVDVPEVAEHSNVEMEDQQVDDEITFKVKKKRGSSSSEDRINMSDELMNVDVDCEQFIADCEEEAR